MSVQAHWIKCDGLPVLICSACGIGILESYCKVRFLQGNRFISENTVGCPFCPNCGAKIDGTPKQAAKGRYNSIHAVNLIRELIDAARQKVPNNTAIHPKSKAFASGVEHGKRMAFDEATGICGQVEFYIGER